MSPGPQPLHSLLRRLRGLPGKARPFGGATLDQDDAALAQRLLDGLEPAGGEQMMSFQREYARWAGVAHATTFFGARVALAAALRALRLPRGSEVVLPNYTCVVVPNALRHVGLRPVFADIELDTYGLDVDALRQAITPDTKAVLLQHLYGLVARDYEACAELAREKGLAVLEDCAQASGALWKETPVGHLGDVAIHSLEKTKVLTTVFGGVATTWDEAVAERLEEQHAAAAEPPEDLTRRLLGQVPTLVARPDDRSSLWPSTSDGERKGSAPPFADRRLPALLAPLGRHQLRKVDRLNAERRTNARRWDKWAASEGLAAATVVRGSVPMFLRYPVLVPADRKRDRSWAKGLGVHAGDWFKGELHPEPNPLPSCPNAAEAVRRCVNLPTLW